MSCRNIALALVAALFIIPARAAPSGAKLFSENCAVCHGEAGTGGIGVPLSLPSFQATITDDYVRKTIRLGRAGRVMPAFTRLTDDEVNAITGYVRSWNQARAAQYPPGAVDGDPAKGEQLYARNCANCHGARGEGGKGTGVTFSRPRDLPIMAPALNNPGFLASAPDAMIKAILMSGRQGTPMVSFLKKGLSEKDIADIVSFVRSFAVRASPVDDLAPNAEKPVIVRESPYDLQTTVENVKQAISNNNFFWGRVQSVEYGFVPPDKASPEEIIIYFCNISFLNQALAVDPRIGMFLPCRITVLEKDGKVYVMSVNPKLLSKLFNNVELDQLCDRMTRSYVAILEEATL